MKAIVLFGQSGSLVCRMSFPAVRIVANKIYSDVYSDGVHIVPNDSRRSYHQILRPQKADLAIGPFTISSSRQTVVDFTQPFMDVGLSILMKKEEDSEYKVFSFLRPFDVYLWLAIVLATVGVGVFLWLHSTFSPHGYHGRVAQASDPSTVTRDQLKTKEHLRFFNAVWSSFAYYVSQGPDVLHPVSLSGRIAVGVWWFAVLIIG